MPMQPRPMAETVGPAEPEDAGLHGVSSLDPAGAATLHERRLDHSAQGPIPLTRSTAIRSRTPDGGSSIAGNLTSGPR